MFPSKALSTSEMNIHQILRLNHCKKLQEWWSEDVDEDCFSLNLYRNTESSIVLFKRWSGGEEISERKSTAKLIINVFLKDLTQIEWSISERKNNGRAYETKTEDKEHHFDHCFEFDTNAKSRFVRLSFILLSKFEKPLVVYITIYQNEIIKMYNLIIFSFFAG